MTGTLILAALVVVYALAAARIEYLYLTGPIVFALVGFVLGSGGVAVVEVGPGSEVARLVTAVTLSLPGMRPISTEGEKPLGSTICILASA